MTPPRKNLSEDLDAQIKTTHDLATRIDERVKLLVENHDKIESKLERFLDKQIDIVSKVIINEQNIEYIEDAMSKIDERISDIEQNHLLLDNFKKGTESTFKNIGKHLVNIILTVLIGYILYVLKFER
jgi:DNA repair exonuclease SbcCD ATPase subunit